MKKIYSLLVVLSLSFLQHAVVPRRVTQMAKVKKVASNPRLL
ncbi:hypothetical protein [Virgibacillus sp. DJP39]